MLKPWMLIGKDPRKATVNIHMCAAGMKDEDTSLPSKRPTTITDLARSLWDPCRSSVMAHTIPSPLKANAKMVAAGHTNSEHWYQQQPYLLPQLYLFEHMTL